MIKNYLIVSLRYILKTRLFSGINILGMILGITCSAILLLYGWSELHYDRFHANGENIYRVTTIQLKNQEVSSVTPGPLAPDLKSKYPEIVSIARLGKWSGVFKTSEHLYQENEIFFADNSFLNIFNYPLIKGNVTTALTKPTDLLITESMAVKYFGSNWSSRPDVIGSSFRLNNEWDYEVVGILQDPPTQSSLHFDFIISFQHIILHDKWGYQWGSHNFHTFVLLAPGHTGEEFSSKIKNELKSHNTEAGFELGVQPLHDMYMNPLSYDYWTKLGNLTFTRIMVLIGFCILLIACFNFINLSTAQSARRAKEIGIRKTIGASRKQIFKQFIFESFLIVIAAALIARGVIDITLPYFNNLFGKSIELPPFWTMIGFSCALVVVIGFLASLFPSTLMSSFLPMTVLKGIYPKQAGKRFREVLVVTQFTIAFILMAGTAIVYLQLSFIQSKNLGFETDQLMYVRLKGELRENEERFRDELKKQHEVISAAASTSLLVDTDNQSNFDWEGKQPENDFAITQINADADLIPLLGMEMLHGRNLSYDILSDTSAYIINATAARKMGYENDEALGKEVMFWGTKGKIIGITKDFHFRPLTVPIEPFIMRYQPETFYFQMLVKVKADQVESLIAKLPDLYQKYDAENPLEYGFVDEQLDKLYQGEQRIASILFHFCILSIFITCLGLLGLATFDAEQRTKEIGIRKVLGASAASIVQLLSVDFVRLILVGVVIGIPIAWWSMNQWLSNFAYHTTPEWWVFAASALLAGIIGFFTIAVQVIRVASTNPTESLKSE